MPPKLSNKQLITLWETCEAIASRREFGSRLSTC